VSILEIITGIKCNKCQNLGVKCRTKTLFNLELGTPGNRLIYIDDKPQFINNVSIGDCPVLNEEIFPNEMAKDLRTQLSKIEKQTKFDIIGNN
jgi:hypothetical protein